MPRVDWKWLSQELKRLVFLVNYSINGFFWQAAHSALQVLQLFRKAVGGLRFIPVTFFF